MMLKQQTNESLQIKRRLNAPIQDVFDAWVNPTSLQQWMCPPGNTVDLVELDVRVGGALRIHIDCEDLYYSATGEYLEILPPERLVFTWVAEQTQFRRSVVTVELAERGNQTDLLLTHQMPAGSVSLHQNGWPGILDHLTEFCQQVTEA